MLWHGHVTYREEIWSLGHLAAEAGSRKGEKGLKLLNSYLVIMTIRVVHSTSPRLSHNKFNFLKKVIAEFKLNLVYVRKLTDNRTWRTFDIIWRIFRYIIVKYYTIESPSLMHSNVLQRWHERLGHQDKRHVRDVLQKCGITVKYDDTKSFCDGCVLGKSHRKPFNARQERAKSVGEIINSDVNGPMSMNSYHGFKYYVVFKYDFSRYTRIFFMKKKSEVATHLQTFLNEACTAGHRVKIFRSDGGGEFNCARVHEILNKHGIQLNLTCPYTPEQNGVAEQSNRHVVELARSMLTVSELPLMFWAHACDTATYLINRTGKSSIPNKAPIELWSGYFITQKAYTRKILKQFGMEDCNPMKTPAESSTPTDASTDIDALNKEIPYRSAIGSLMYLACATRPDIAYAVSRAARSMSNPSTSDWTAVKRILRYLKGTIDLGLNYTSTGRELCAFTDADFAGDVNTRRSTNGFVSLLGNTAVSWMSQLQRSVALSTMEAEFVAGSEGAKELIWLNRLLTEIKNKTCTPTLYIDNASAIKLTKNPEFHKRSKHIEVRYFYIRELFQAERIKVEHVRSEDQLGDMFTKPLGFDKFKSMCAQIGLSV
ncbi:unnamed protein product [Trichogramma brassicae]|uniref:Integrase catalytic domain-containing protein n=1 Tax=Trichogramma brassicae TaxID=86971 RepID=A0A6H5II39_9HYME|nr:unnamed protein product [Trichogramma brassicae]